MNPLDFTSLHFRYISFFVAHGPQQTNLSSLSPLSWFAMAPPSHANRLTKTYSRKHQRHHSQVDPDVSRWEQTRKPAHASVHQMQEKQIKHTTFHRKGRLPVDELILLPVYDELPPLPSINLASSGHLNDSSSYSSQSTYSRMRTRQSRLKSVLQRKRIYRTTTVPVQYSRTSLAQTKESISGHDGFTAYELRTRSKPSPIRLIINHQSVKKTSTRKRRVLSQTLPLAAGPLPDVTFSPTAKLEGEQHPLHAQLKFDISSCAVDMDVGSECRLPCSCHPYQTPKSSKPVRPIENAKESSERLQAPETFQPFQVLQLPQNSQSCQDIQDSQISQPPKWFVYHTSDLAKLDLALHGQKNDAEVWMSTISATSNRIYENTAPSMDTNREIAATMKLLKMDTEPLDEEGKAFLSRFQGPCNGW